MSKLKEVPPALSIRQPWADLIVREEKTIEVRGWNVKHRGPILVHVSNTIDWKTAELLDYGHAFDLPRGAIVAVTEIIDVFEFTRESWLRCMPRHRVIHPPVQVPTYGVVLGPVITMNRNIPCRGKPLLFLVPQRVEARTRTELVDLGLIDPTT